MIKKPIEVKLAKKGTIMAKFQDERTKALAEMFNSPDEYRIYPTTKFFIKLDKALKKALAKQRKEFQESASVEKIWEIIKADYKTRCFLSPQFHTETLKKMKDLAEKISKSIIK